MSDVSLARESLSSLSIEYRRLEDMTAADVIAEGRTLIIGCQPCRVGRQFADLAGLAARRLGQSLVSMVFRCAKCGKAAPRRSPAGMTAVSTGSPDFDPGVPLAHYLTHGEHCHGVLFACSCGDYRVIPIQTVIDDLRSRGVGGSQTGIRQVRQFIRRPCQQCGGRAVETIPAWAPGPR